MKKVIFHFPEFRNVKLCSASTIRPFIILDTLRKHENVEVFEIVGSRFDRYKAMKRIKKMILDGVKFDLVYSESSTSPTIFASGKENFLRYWYIDYELFFLCWKNGIKVKLFYRDIHWLFNELIDTESFFKRFVYKFFYWIDLIIYKYFVDTVYLPAKRMEEIMPVTIKKIEVLPPGLFLDDFKEFEIKTEKENLTIVYVGGIGNLYEMTVLFNAAKILNFIDFIFVFRKDEWNSVKEAYMNGNKYDNIFIEHRNNTELGELFKRADIGLFYLKLHEYLKYTIPFKIFEYMSHALPVIATQGSEAADFVEKNDVGWSIEYDEETIVEFLKSLSLNRGLVKEKSLNIARIIRNHTWQKRIDQILE